MVTTNPHTNPASYAIDAVDASKAVYDRKNVTIACETTGADALIRKAPIGGIPIVAFQGTSCMTDLKTDLKFRMVRVGLGGDRLHIRVHRGCWAAWKSIRNDVFSEILEVGAKHVLLTGHSLGGMLAYAAAVNMGFSLKDVCCSVVTFGAPRVGDSEFVKAFKMLQERETIVSTARFVHVRDVIPRTPPWLCGYRHVCKPTYLDSKNLMFLRNNVKEAHLMDTYVDSINASYSILPQDPL